MRAVRVVGAILGLGLVGWAMLGCGTRAPPRPTGPPRDITATVTSVVDGDTIDVTVTGVPAAASAAVSVGQRVQVRYIGVDAPEQGHPQYQAATDLNAALVQGRTVHLELDEQVRDRYDRLLAYVYLDPDRRLMVNLMLVATDIVSARSDPGTERYADLFAHYDAVPKSPVPGAPAIPWQEARARVGDVLCVEGPVASVGRASAGHVFLNLGLPFSDPGRFTLFIPAPSVARFEAQFGPEFWTNLRGRVVRASGPVTVFDGVPEIRLTDPASLFVD